MAKPLSRRSRSACLTRGGALARSKASADADRNDIGSSEKGRGGGGAGSAAGGRGGALDGFRSQSRRYLAGRRRSRVNIRRAQLRGDGRRETIPCRACRTIGRPL